MVGIIYFFVSCGKKHFLTSGPKKHYISIFMSAHEKKLKDFEAWVITEGLIKPNGLTIGKTKEGGYGLVFESLQKFNEYQKVTIILRSLKLSVDT